MAGASRVHLEAVVAMHGRDGDEIEQQPNDRVIVVTGLRSMRMLGLDAKVYPAPNRLPL
jgi:hypothetical protein